MLADQMRLRTLTGSGDRVVGEKKALVLVLHARQMMQKKQSLRVDVCETVGCQEQLDQAQADRAG